MLSRSGRAIVAPETDVLLSGESFRHVSQDHMSINLFLTAGDLCGISCMVYFVYGVFRIWCPLL